MKHKHLLFLFLAAFCNQGTWSQKLTAEGNSFLSGGHVMKQQVEHKEPGSTGRSLLWDFRDLKPVNKEYVLDYFIPDSMRMDTICGLEHRTRYLYSRKNDCVRALGFKNATTRMEYSKPEMRLRFPFAYGDSLYSEFEGKGQYSHRLNLDVKGYTSVKADAEGDLEFPGSQIVKKALRLHTRRYYTETSKDSLEMTLDTYAWYAEGVRYPVFESVQTNLIRHTNGADAEFSDTTVFSTSFHYPPEKQTSRTEDTSAEQPQPTITPIGAEAVFTEASITLNPVIDNIHISYKLTRPAQIWFSVHNSIGIPVRTTPPLDKPEGYNAIEINIAGQLRGGYVVYVQVDNMVLQRTTVKK